MSAEDEDIFFEEFDSDLGSTDQRRWERGARSLCKWFFGTSELQRLKAIRARAHPDKHHSSGFISDITWYHLAHTLICVLSPNHDCELASRERLREDAHSARTLPTPMDIEPDKTTPHTEMMRCVRMAQQSLAESQAAVDLSRSHLPTLNKESLTPTEVSQDSVVLPNGCMICSTHENKKACQVFHDWESRLRQKRWNRNGWAKLHEYGWMCPSCVFANKCVSGVQRGRQLNNTEWSPIHKCHISRSGKQGRDIYGLIHLTHLHK